MKCLLDTHTLLWFLDDNPRLSVAAKATIENAENQITVSIVSLWETGIKLSIGKLSMSVTMDGLFEEVSRLGFRVMTVEGEHVRKVAQLPLHHRDPFDRMLIAQAMHERLSLVSCDPAVDPYGVQRIW